MKQEVQPYIKKYKSFTFKCPTSIYINHFVMVFIKSLFRDSNNSLINLRKLLDKVVKNLFYLKE